MLTTALDSHLIGIDFNCGLRGKVLFSEKSRI